MTQGNQLNHILAVSLVVICLIAAIIGGTRPTPEPPRGGVSFEAARGGDRIELVNLEGTIGGSRGSGFVSLPTSPLDQLRDAVQDRSVKAVLLRINSPGGAVGSSQELYRAVTALHEVGKPVIAIMEDIAASGGYYVASAADKIYANPGTLTGSIGVIISGLSFGELLENYGIEPQTFKTGEFKDILSPFRTATPQEQRLLQDLVENTLDQFIRDVAQGRQHLPEEGADEVLDAEMIARREGLDEARVRELADGRIFTGAQALEVGLVDALGGYTEAVEDLRLMTGDPSLSPGGEADNFQRTLRRLLSQGLTSQGQNSGLARFFERNEATRIPGVPLLWMAPEWALR
ncbi:signal peptide peptidase SppA [Synechococcus sp. Nb3U1]|uniref:signal peptide peptidase SppA n=1 Tax=Synechococcus sp. Nb3U1 TaxID=1914529 RepID=UPI001F1C7D82|nr:signal peptide peptidase SppA [Synechococcus sp. Nb3U1]MCF2972687.1 signal peptide peptidase SppA [Synechococcus sp. Nb3U1]